MDLGPEWHDISNRYGVVGALAAIILLILVYKSPSLIEQIRKSCAYIALYREANDTTGDTLADRNKRLDQRIRAAKAIENGDGEASDDDK